MGVRILQIKDSTKTKRNYICALKYTYIVHDDYIVCSFEVVELVSDEHAGGVAQVAGDTLVEQLPAHVRVHG